MSSDLGQLKEFLAVYNHLTDLCFNHCIRSLNQRQLSTEEESCVNQCMDKFVNCNQRLMQIFMRYGPEFMQQKQKQQQQGQQK